MPYGAEIPLDEVVHFDITTHSPQNGAVTNADSTPTWAVYEEATDTAILTGDFTQRTALTGNYRGTFTASAANGFEVGKWYNVIASATVNNRAGKQVTLNFRLVAAETTVGEPTVSSVGAVTGAVGSVTASVTVGTNNDKTGYRLSATGVDDVLDEVVEGSTTFRQMLRAFMAALAGKAAGLDTTTVTFRDAADSKDRITATVDEFGNRTVVTLDLT
jgi:hypothetical protein